MAVPNEELRNALLDDPMKVLAIAGTGVSIAVSGNERCASWDSLINDGIQLCSDRGVGNPEWVFRARELVRTGDFISAAEMITESLGGPRSGAFAQWLNERYTSFPIKDNRIITELNKLECAIGTTNYDPLIENVTHRPVCTWQDEHLLGQVWDPAIRRVLHFHGVFDRPDTVIFGHRSYTKQTRRINVTTRV
jgi:hypothetical protein